MTDLFVGIRPAYKITHKKDSGIDQSVLPGTGDRSGYPYT